MKWRNVSISLFVITLLILLAWSVKLYLLRNDSDIGHDFKHENLQLGYYDLLGQQREIYDTRFDIKGSNILMTLTNPNDNRFMAKVNFERQKSDAQSVWYHYRQLFHSGEGQPLMIKNILGYAENNNIRFNRLHLGSQQLLITPFGQIFSYPG